MFCVCASFYRYYVTRILCYNFEVTAMNEKRNSVCLLLMFPSLRWHPSTDIGVCVIMQFEVVHEADLH